MGRSPVSFWVPRLESILLPGKFILASAHVPQRMRAEFARFLPSRLY